jgi:fatty-acyl-CoA synthase
MNPAGVALRQGERAVTFAELARRVDGRAGALAGLGVEPGERVAYLGPNDIATFETFFATARLGGIFVPLNIRLSGPEIAYMLGDCGARVLVYGPECADLATAADPAGAGVTHLVSVAGSCPAGGQRYDDLVGGGSAPQAAVGLDDDAVILYTSGTTGRPKGAVLTHGNITFNTVNQLTQVDMLSGDVVLCTAPLFHVSGLGQVSLPTLIKGGTVVVAPRFDPAWLLATVAALRITAFAAVPTMLQLIADHPDFAAADLSSLRYIIYGGSPARARVAGAWLERGVQLLQGYGMTETAPGVLLAMPGGAVARPVSAGVPQFFVDLALARPDGTAASAGTAPPVGTGQLLVAGPAVFSRYWNRPADTAAATAGGWFHTGDVVRIEDDGWGYVVDRVTDMIISGGENVYPAEVEAALADLPAIADCAVVGVPDERWGEVGLAIVVPAPGHTVDVDCLRRHLDGRLAHYKIPRHVRLVEAIPRTATGKIRRAELRTWVAAPPEPAG